MGQILDWFSFDVIGSLFPAFRIWICYFKVYKALKTTYDAIIQQTKISPARLFIYVVIPFLCFMPWSLADLYNICTGLDYPFSVLSLQALSGVVGVS